MQSHMWISVGLIFAAVFVAGFGLQLLLNDLRQKRIQRRLNEVVQSPAEAADPAIVRDRKLSALPLFDLLLRQLSFVPRIERLLLQADSSMSVGTVLLLTAALAAGGGFVVFELTRSVWLCLPAIFLLGSIPLLALTAKKRKRVRRFEEQLPDALDLITGALRAGMAFTGALQLVAEESPDPVAKEFMIVFEEHRLGLDLHEALHKMIDRVDTRELQLFVAAVLL